MKLLVVEDEAPTAAFLRRGLTEEGYTVDVAVDAEEADRAMAVTLYDLVLLDVMLPGGSGFNLCQHWRKNGYTRPIFFLTARDAVLDRVTGLDMGADDYILKPFAFEELLARIRAHLRRPVAGEPNEKLQVGGLVVDTARRRVELDGEVLALTSREYQLLEYMLRRPDRVITRTALWENIWETDEEPSSNVIDVYIRHLRGKLGPDYISTIRGAGYVLRTDAAAH